MIGTKNRFIAVALLSLLFCTTTVFAKSSVWKVSKGDDYFYLGGTFHVLSPADHPLPEEFLQAYSDAQELIFETDMMAISSPEFQQKMMGAMVFSDERTLASELDAETYLRLKTFMEARQLPIDSFAQYQPWAVSLILTMQESVKLGMAQQYGVDSHFHQLASVDEKIIQSLETPEQQLEFLQALAKIDGDINIDYTLRDLGQLPEIIEELKRGWRSGDLTLLENNVSVVQLRDEYPEVYQALLVTRNNNWMKQLVTLFNDNAIEIVLVGAMHLVGQEGLVNQLQLQGFNVEQLD